MTKSEVLQHKITDLQTLKHKISMWHFLGRKVVFTNGCFDVLHHGHVYLLAKAAELESNCMVVVGLNADESVKQLKGPDRPVNKFEDRAYLLAGLFVVDAVIGFNEQTPIELIKQLEIDFLVKGGDYKEDEIVGADIVKANGGKVIVVPLLENFSSTGLINKMSNN